MLIFCVVANNYSRKKLHKLLPEAEVKIQLAILKLEQKHSEKIAHEEYQVFRSMEGEEYDKIITLADSIIN